MKKITKNGTETRLGATFAWLARRGRELVTSGDLLGLLTDIRVALETRAIS
jgi:uncharacterized protein (UPF0264 family)